MQKVEGSSPFIRSSKPAGNGGFFVFSDVVPAADQGDVGVPVSVVTVSSTVSVTVSITVVVSCTVSVTVWITVVVGSVRSLIDRRPELTGPSGGVAKYTLPRVRSRNGPSTV